MKEDFYAHTLEGNLPETWQRLEDHLKNVVGLAQTFVDDFNVEVY